VGGEGTRGGFPPFSGGFPPGARGGVFSGGGGGGGFVVFVFRWGPGRGGGLGGKGVDFLDGKGGETLFFILWGGGPVDADTGRLPPCRGLSGGGLRGFSGAGAGTGGPPGAPRGPGPGPGFPSVVFSGGPDPGGGGGGGLGPRGGGSPFFFPPAVYPHPGGGGGGGGKKKKNTQKQFWKKKFGGGGGGVGGGMGGRGPPPGRPPRGNKPGGKRGAVQDGAIPGDVSDLEQTGAPFISRGGGGCWGGRGGGAGLGFSPKGSVWWGFGFSEASTFHRLTHDLWKWFFWGPRGTWGWGPGFFLSLQIGGGRGTATPVFVHGAGGLGSFHWGVGPWLFSPVGNRTKPPMRGGGAEGKGGKGLDLVRGQKPVFFFRGWKRGGRAGGASNLGGWAAGAVGGGKGLDDGSSTISRLYLVFKTRVFFRLSMGGGGGTNSCPRPGHFFFPWGKIRRARGGRGIWGLLPAGDKKKNFGRPGATAGKILTEHGGL